jgi:hypothetical protein
MMTVGPLQRAVTHSKQLPSHQAAATAAAATTVAQGGSSPETDDGGGQRREGHAPRRAAAARVGAGIAQTAIAQRTCRAAAAAS